MCSRKNTDGLVNSRMNSSSPKYRDAYCDLPLPAIAVGTALTGGPPHRSQRALLTHWAPTSGHDAQSLFGIRVQCSMLDDCHQPSVVDGIEESTDVRVEYPVLCQNSALLK